MFFKYFLIVVLLVASSACATTSSTEEQEHIQERNDTSSEVAESERREVTDDHTVPILQSIEDLQGDTRRRIALVIGNSEYQIGPLVNPRNDAEDLAQALEAAGFQVLLRLDRTLSQMEQDLGEFRTALRPGDVAKLFYAGHAVQVDGENFLLPIDNRGINDPGTLRRRAINSNEYIQVMTQQDTSLNIIVLDACRDNPLPQTTRGGSRGLTVMDRPSGSETVIVFATQANQVAQDGTGRNSPFTQAFLQEISEPDVELTAFFNRVGTQVRSQTNGAQVPALYTDPLSQPFVFFSSFSIAQQAQRASLLAQEELARLEADITRRQAAIQATRDNTERQRLELELQRQEALEAAQRIEAANLAAEAQRAAEQARITRDAEQQRLAALQQSQAQQRELARVAEQRRQELERLSQQASSDDPDVLIETINRLEGVLNEVNTQYATLIREAEQGIRRNFAPQFASINRAEPEIWETDAEFRARNQRERSALEATQNEEVRTRQDEIRDEQNSQTESIRGQLEQALNTLETKRWTLVGSAVQVVPGEFDRNERTWPFRVQSRDARVPFGPVTVVAGLGSTANPQQAIIDLNNAVQAGAITGEITWRIARNTTDRRYEIRITDVTVRNLSTNEPVVTQRREVFAGVVAFGLPMSRVRTAAGRLTISSSVPGGTLFLNGTELGKLPQTIPVEVGPYEYEVRWQEFRTVRDTGTMPVAGTQRVTAVPTFHIGERGTAGGIVFYDKGNYSDGWRYLEAWTTDESGTYLWKTSRTSTPGTSTAIGSGYRNTYSAMSGTELPAAQQARNANHGGFNDWFLPSKDELNLMHWQRRVIGGFASDNYWSSSEYDSDVAWGQHFSTGLQSSYGKSSSYRVRVVRAF